MKIPYELYQERVQQLFKLLEPYLDKKYHTKCSLAEIGHSALVAISIREGCHDMIAQFLKQFFHCDVTYGKDRFGKLNGYLLISLSSDRFNSTSWYTAALALHRLSSVES